MKYWLILFLIVSGCKSSHIDSKEQQKINQKPQIIFLNYVFTSQYPLPPKVSIQNIQKVEGTFKQRQLSKYFNNSIDHFKCSIRSKTNALLYEELFEDPLHKTVEFFNEDNSLQKKSVNLDSGVFNLRIQLTHISYFIEITDHLDHLLLKHKL